MIASTVKYLMVVAAVFALSAKAKPIELKREEITAASVTGRTLFDQYTLGQDVDGARIIYTSQYQQSFDSVQSEITLEYVFPGPDASNDSLITKITLYVEASDDATTQAYVIDGGIGQTSITLQIVAHNSDYLRYMVIVYGK
ncbi:uncharacterized protein LOC106096048 [Stomoxys calcitrans]|uniref:Uncharacterized protein n=1 Tax=Stomoxys calcitrans TaxID=35570 RepID=A0A1I8P2L4_STOCA|nr:uncharacterized protein LOC106096048 [Stomoxys calcitrans]